MKKRLVFLLALALLTAVSAQAEPGTIFPWRGYTMDVLLVTTDAEVIKAPSLHGSSAGTQVMVRLAPTNGTVRTEDIKAYIGDFRFRDADGENWENDGYMLRAITRDPKGGLPVSEPEQAFFDVLFFLKDKGEGALSGAKLTVATEKEGERILVALDQAPRELPIARSAAIEEGHRLLAKAEELAMRLPEVGEGETLYLAATPGVQADELLAAFVLNAEGDSLHNLVLMANYLHFTTQQGSRNISLNGGKQTKLFYNDYPVDSGLLEAGSCRLEGFALEGDTASATLYYVYEGQAGTVPFRMDFDPAALTFYAVR